MSRRPGRAARALLLALLLALCAPLAAAACAPAAAPGGPTAGGADGGQPAPPPPPRPLPPGTPAETHGGVPYDPTRDRGCVCGPNGGAERYKARVYRWSDDCLRSQEPACATRDAAIADSVERLYSEFVCGATPWQDSGFLAPPPGWAASRHNRASLFASATCVGGQGREPGGLGGGGLDVESFFLRVLRETVNRLLGGFVAVILGEIGRTGDTVLDDGGACALYRPGPALTYGHPAVRAWLGALRALALGVLIAGLGIGLLGKFGLGGLGVATVGGLELLGSLALTAGLIALWPTAIAALLDLTNLIVLAILPLGLPNGLGFGDLAVIAPNGFVLTPKAALLLLNGGATLLVIAQAILRVALLDLLIVLGPPALGCLVLPQLRPWFDRWARLLAGCFVLNIVQALALRFAGTLAAGLPRREDPTGILGALAAIVALLLVFRLPRMIAPHADQGGAIVGQLTRQATGAAVALTAAIATGGGSAAAQGALAAGGAAGAAGGAAGGAASAAGGGSALGGAALGGGATIPGGMALGAGAALPAGAHAPGGTALPADLSAGGGIPLIGGASAPVGPDRTGDMGVGAGAGADGRSERSAPDRGHDVAPPDPTTTPGSNAAAADGGPPDVARRPDAPVMPDLADSLRAAGEAAAGQVAGEIDDDPSGGRDG